MQTKIRLKYADNGPLRPSITDMDSPDLAWVENEIDALAAGCACEGPECDPAMCPRFGDECAGCGAWVESGNGAYLLDGDETYGDCCIEWCE